MLHPKDHYTKVLTSGLIFGYQLFIQLNNKVLILLQASKETWSLIINAKSVLSLQYWQYIVLQYLFHKCFNNYLSQLLIVEKAPNIMKTRIKLECKKGWGEVNIESLSNRRNN